MKSIFWVALLVCAFSLVCDARKRKVARQSHTHKKIMMASARLHTSHQLRQNAALKEVSEMISNGTGDDAIPKDKMILASVQAERILGRGSGIDRYQ